MGFKTRSEDGNFLVGVAYLASMVLTWGAGALLRRKGTDMSHRPRPVCHRSSSPFTVVVTGQSCRPLQIRIAGGSESKNELS